MILPISVSIFKKFDALFCPLSRYCSVRIVAAIFYFFYLLINYQRFLLKS